MHASRLFLYIALGFGVILAGLAVGVATGSARIVNPGLIIVLATVFGASLAASILLSELPSHTKAILLAILVVAAAIPLLRLSPRIALAILVLLAALIIAYVAVEARRMMLERYR